MKFDFLNNLPLASVTFVAGLVLIVIGYVSGDVSFERAYELLTYLGGGSAAIGFVRNQAGHGKR